VGDFALLILASGQQVRWQQKANVQNVRGLVLVKGRVRVVVESWSLKANYVRVRTVAKVTYNVSSSKNCV
jgi:hypothetical protein